MYRAFPGSDYYGVSVTIGLAPLRRSRVPYAWDDRAATGAPSVSLRSLYRDLVSRRVTSRWTGRRSRIYVDRLLGNTGSPTVIPGPTSFTEWTLGFNQFGLHHTAQVLADMTFDGFQTFDLFRHATVPFRFRVQVSLTTYGHSLIPSRIRPRIPTRRDATHGSTNGPSPTPWPPTASRRGRSCRCASTRHRLCTTG